MKGTQVLFHTGFQIIEKPDIHIGRKNADFGQGFYLTDDEEFSKRWAKERNGSDTYINKYTLTFDGLNVKEFSKTEDWYEYIYNNRSAARDELKEFDVIVGPIANDTIYDTLGIISSGFLEKSQAFSLLMIGDTYMQIVIKSEKACNSLKFVEAKKLDKEEIFKYHDLVEIEEKVFQEEFAKTLEKVLIN